MAVRQISDGTPDGQSLGRSTSDPISFYNGATVAQPSGSGQSAVPRGQAGGVIATFSTTQSPTAVTTITTVESDMTVVSGTGASMAPITGDFWYVNKPTAQAGLGMGNVRQKSAGVVSVNFSNPTGSTLTPTASEVYKLVCLRGVGSFTQALTPSAVPANSTQEQQFTITTTSIGGGSGLPVGELLQVSKPTSQSGLDITGCRIVSSNVIGITFSNVTAAAITPTAAESYRMFSLAGLDAANNDIMYGFNVGTVGAISAGVVITGGATTLTGVAATDVVTGIFKPTPQATATNIATPIYGIPTANTLTLYFLGTGSGSTPTASEVYGIRTFRPNPAAPLLLYSSALTPVSVAATTCAEQTFTVTGLVAGSPVWVNKPTATNGLGIAGVRVSAADTLAINYINTSGSAIVPPAETYVVGNFQVPAPGAANCVYQTVLAALDDNMDLTNALRAALVPTTGVGLIAGG